MLGIIFSSRPFIRKLNNAKTNWLGIDPKEAVEGIVDLIDSL